MLAAWGVGEFVAKQGLKSGRTVEQSGDRQRLPAKLHALDGDGAFCSAYLDRGRSRVEWDPASPHACRRCKEEMAADNV